MDIVDRDTRSRMMAAVRSKDTAPEVSLRRALFRDGYRYAGPDLADATMIRTIVREVIAEMGIQEAVSKANTAAQDTVPEKPSGANGADVKQRQKTTILQTAIDWQRRQRSSFGLQLSGESLVQFLTPGDLQSVLKNKKAGMCEEGGCFDKAQLTTYLTDLKAIRDAIAHNQPISVQTLQNLQAIYDYLIHSLASRPDTRQNTTMPKPM